MFLGQNRRAGSDAADQGKHQRGQGRERQRKAGAACRIDGAHGIGAQANAARCAADQIYDALAGQCLQMLFCSIGRLEAEGAGNLGPGRGRTRASDADWMRSRICCWRGVSLGWSMGIP